MKITVDEDILNADMFPSNRKKSYFTKFEGWFYLIFYTELSGGTFHVQISSLAKEWNWSRTKVRNYLNYLESINEINIVKIKDSVIITRVVEHDKKDIEKDIRKDTEKNMQKDILKTENINICGMFKNSEKDIKKNTQKDTEKNIGGDTEERINVDNILDIIKM